MTAGHGAEGLGIAVRGMWLFLISIEGYTLIVRMILVILIAWKMWNVVLCSLVYSNS